MDRRSGSRELLHRTGFGEVEPRLGLSPDFGRGLGLAHTSTCILE